MSSFATMYSFAKKHGLRYFVTPEQADQLSYYFEPEQLSLNVIDKILPWYNRLYWLPKSFRPRSTKTNWRPTGDQLETNLNQLERSTKDQLKII